MSYNPLDMVEVNFNGHEILARPTALDGEITNYDNMTDKKGVLVKPSEFVTTCPDCGDGVQFSYELNGEPPFKIEYSCIDYCSKCPIKKSSNINPFVPPVEILDPAVSDTIAPVKEQHSFEETIPEVNVAPVEQVLEQLEEIIDHVDAVEDAEGIQEAADVTQEHIEVETIQNVENETAELIDVLSTIDEAPKKPKKAKKQKDDTPE